jgi:glycosyltransferase involved in cell wall biosynthesis
MASPATGRRTCACTIVSRNYFHYARTLMDSVRAAHPDWEQCVLLVDEFGRGVEPTGHPFEVIDVAALGLPNFKQFAYRYNILELNTAVKPWLLRLLLGRGGADRVVYFDPDIQVYAPLREVEEAFDAGAFMVLTPHLLQPITDDGHYPDDLHILRAGCFNLGFLALARGAQLDPFLDWWQRRLEFQCCVDFAQGLFVDQKWLDLAPGLYDNVAVLRHPGYNVAYWNLPHRALTKAGHAYQVNGRPLVFFHFSGLNPDAPESLSKYQDRYRLEDLGRVRDLFDRYCDVVRANEYSTYRKIPYAFGAFTDGTGIPDCLRRHYRQSADVRRRLGPDPFATGSAYYQEPWGHGRPFMNRYMAALWEVRSGLEVQFPFPTGASRLNFVTDFLWYLAADEKTPPAFVDPVARSAPRGLGLLARMRPLARLFVPQPLRRHIRNTVTRLRGGGEAAAETSAPAAPAARQLFPGRRPGLNIVGYVRSEHGIGESARLCARSAAAAAVPFSLYDFNVGNSSRTANVEWDHRVRVDNPHRVNLLHINADQMPVAREHLGAAFFEGRYNIGFWHWELPELPDDWLPSFAPLDEVWVPTHFVADAVSRKSPLPVVRMPHAVRVSARPAARRGDFGLPEGTFLFLTMYDTHSVQMRKNPGAAVEAFRRAFAGRRDVALVVKINNPDSYPDEVRALRDRLAGWDNALVLDRILSRQEVYDLESLCDSFVSLHRSEGFGLGLAESMYLGKPVIGTGWSGNVDFMNEQNSCPVSYRLVRLEQDFGPYPAGQFWADPDVDHAAWYMRKLTEEPAWRDEVAARGRETIRTEFAPEVIGRLYRERLAHIDGRLADDVPGSTRLAA